MPAMTSEIATGLRRWRGSGEAGLPIPAVCRWISLIW